MGERPYRLDRMLVQLRLTGLLARASAVVFGQMPRCDETDGAVTAKATVADVMSDFPGPILYGFPSGHTTTSAVCVATMVWLLLAARGPLPGPRVRVAVTASGLVVGAVTGWAALLADNHWLSDVMGGLLLACVVVVIGLELGTRLVVVRATQRTGDGL